ncbi:hypothetical protein QO034_07930 [Sedimentitalea sp. JM2-8]|uniref:Sulfotransferase family protein n=1 Tax=Sedimentitalea xiamensis TaxID=3050037 RepID=A0ABT7FDY3_9RHOB|nr:hypothetical protein [Sedimentitalea xiamensis]MDK3073034.1 hypothetical protein [Sedimentitalea xiamensis]
MQRTGPVPTRFEVLGERSSGTNLTHRLFGRNTALKPARVLGWKHGFPCALAIPEDLAVVCVVRNAVDWALSMHEKPWHATPELQALDFSAFIRAPWQTIIDRPRYFGGVQGMSGQPLQQDRNPLDGAVFANLFKMRNAKLAGLQTYLKRRCTCVFLRLENLQADPRSTLDEVLAGLGHAPRSEAFRPVTKRLGNRFKPAIASRPGPPDRIGHEDLAFLRDQCDPTQEQAMGYGY